MVVMLWSTDCIAAAATSGVQFADEPQFGKHLEGPVNGYQPDVGVKLTHLLVYCSRSQVVLGGGNYLYYRPSLRGQFIAVLSQGSYYFALCRPHLKL